jgi:hypothetical protein
MTRKKRIKTKAKRSKLMGRELSLQDLIKITAKIAPQRLRKNPVAKLLDLQDQDLQGLLILLRGVQPILQDQIRDHPEMDLQEVLHPPQEAGLELQENPEQILLKVGARIPPQEEIKDLGLLLPDLLDLQPDPPEELLDLRVLPNLEEDPEQNPQRIRRIKFLKKK